jgi:hypothetical protein
MQLDLSDIPAELGYKKENKLLQIFFCQGECDSIFDQLGYFVRTINKYDENDEEYQNSLSYDYPDPSEMSEKEIKEKIITGWELKEVNLSHLDRYLLEKDFFFSFVRPHNKEKFDESLFLKNYFTSLKNFIPDKESSDDRDFKSFIGG